MPFRGVQAEMVLFQGFNPDRCQAYYADSSGERRFPGVVVIHRAPCRSSPGQPFLADDMKDLLDVLATSKHFDGGKTFVFGSGRASYAPMERDNQA